MNAKVVDASVMAAWCFQEPRAPEAIALLRDSELYAPLLLAYELTSIARRKTTLHPEKAVALSKALRIALTVPIKWREVDHPAVLRLALNTNLTTYDACYLYLARSLGATLATFDQQLARAV
jgi:predicted nucleic acid-binding protein